MTDEQAGEQFSLLNSEQMSKVRCDQACFLVEVYLTTFRWPLYQSRKATPKSQTNLFLPGYFGRFIVHPLGTSPMHGSK